MKDILTSSKNKFGPMRHLVTRKQDVYPIIENENKNTIKIDKRILG